MKDIIIGCGRMGSGLAQKLIAKGHSVTVIDTNPDAFKLLGTNFKGTTIVGVGFDKGVLAEAKISMVDAVIACTSSDETNALVGRISRNIYRVPRVIARLFDPRKAEIYRSLGIETISTTSWGIQRASEMLSYNQLDSILTLGDGSVEMVRVEMPNLLVGRTVNELTAIGEIQVVAISRDNKTFIPTNGTTLLENDIIFISVLSTSARRLKELLGLEQKRGNIK
jgi:trk system potassium uptake protein